MSEDKHYIGNLGEPTSKRDTLALAAGLLALSLVTGFAIGLGVWIVLWASGALTSLLWETLPQALGQPVWLPFVTCVVGGIIIGLWTAKFDNAPKDLNEVLGCVKKTGGYQLHGNPVTNAVSFLLPLAFGGSVGPEAGLTGIIAAGCTWIGSNLRKAGIRAKTLADVTTAATLSAIFGTPLLGIAAAAGPLNVESDEQFDLFQDRSLTYRKGAKLVMYVIAALGAFGGIFLVKHFLGGGMGMPHFGSCSTNPADFLWVLPCLLVSYLLALLYLAAEKAAHRASSALGNRPVLKPIIAGVLLGVAATLLPITLFAGEEQATELMTSWITYPAYTLALIAVVKVLLTALCLNFGWKGGHFFPCIFAGVACGYALAVVSGADPMLMVIVSSSAFMGGIMRKPIVAAALLLLCFPLTGMVWGVAAAFIGAKLPIPRALLDEQTATPNSTEKPSTSKEE